MNATRLFGFLCALSVLADAVIAAPPPIGYFSVSESDPVVPFETGDSLYCGVHSNQTIAFAGRPVFHRSVRISGEEFIYIDDANPQFAIEPLSDVAPGRFPTWAAREGSFRAGARYYISDQNGRMMTWIRFRGDAQMDVYQYPLGEERAENLIDRIRVWYGQNIFVDGELEIDGTFGGVATIISAQRIHLLNDVLYRESDRQTGEFTEANTESNLNILAAGDILIANTVANGKFDGWNEEPDNFDRHSILLNGSYVSFGGGLTFENRNYDGEPDQGTYPDERGRVFLKGSLHQAQHKELHNENHDGTGYHLTMKHDNRYNDDDYYLGISDPWDIYLHGEMETVTINCDYNYYIRQLECREFIARPGAEATINSWEDYPFSISERFIIEGAKDLPVILHNSNPERGKRLITVGRHRNSFISINHLTLDTGFTFLSEADSVTISNSRLVSDLEFTDVSSCRIDSSEILGNVTISSSGAARLYRNLFKGSVQLEGNLPGYDFRNNTLISARRVALTIDGEGECLIVNSIFAYNDEGVYGASLTDPVLKYCLFWDNRRADASECRFGDGNLFTDPLLVNWRRGDYNLTDSSPCIDSGDPDSPLDPDGSRADIGAFPFDHRLAVDPQSPPSIEVGVGGVALRASPNPFNSSTVLTFRSAESAKSAVALKIYSLSGQCVASFTLTPAETSSVAAPPATAITWNATFLPAGIYIARLDNGSETHSLKLIKVD